MRLQPRQLAFGLALAGAACLVLGLAARLGEFAVVFGIFLLALAGGVLNWDRRAGH
ncbi:MAG: hypothetical protein ACR2NO_08000 [Chloroflexota bacterium]